MMVLHGDYVDEGEGVSTRRIPWGWSIVYGEGHLGVFGKKHQIVMVELFWAEWLESF